MKTFVLTQIRGDSFRHAVKAVAESLPCGLLEAVASFSAMRLRPWQKDFAMRPNNGTPYFSTKKEEDTAHLRLHRC